MSSPELSNLEQNRLPVVTQEVLDNLASKGFDSIESVQFMEKSDPKASESLWTYVNGMAVTHSEKLVAYRAGAYVYTLLHEAQNTEQKSE